MCKIMKSDAEYMMIVAERRRSNAKMKTKGEELKEGGTQAETGSREVASCR